MSFKKYLFDKIFESATLFGTPVFYGFFVLVLLAFGSALYLKIILALIFTELLCILIRLIYKKERPVAKTAEIFFERLEANSFPSSHTARISLLTTMVYLSYKNPMLSLIFFFASLLVGYSRIYLKRHYFLDVLFGYIIGVAIGVVAFYI